MIDLLLLGLRGLITLSLLLFLGLAFSFIWRDLQKVAGSSAALQLSPAALHVLHCESGDLSPGQSFGLDRHLSIGRAATCNILIDDPAVSSRHALILWQEGRFWIEDQNSRNGTYLNGEPIQTRSPLVDGDLLAIGGTQFRVRMGAETSTAKDGGND